MKQLLILITLILAGCSAQKKETGATFKVGIRSLTAAGAVSEFPGGLMLFGKATDRSFGRIMAASSQDEMIPNGVWDFYVIGWDGSGAGTPMTGKIYCALQKAVELNGEPVEINLKATNANCAAPVFGGVYVDANGDNHFPKINIETCNRLDGVKASSICEYTSASSSSYKRTKGAALSYAIMANSYNKVGPDFRILESPQFRSECSAVSGGSGAGLQTNNFIAADLNIPSGSEGSPFAFNLRAYFGSANCNDDYGHVNIPMLNGAKPTNPKAVGFRTASGENTIFTKVTAEDVCSWTGLSSTPFKGGNGTNGLPYIICNGAELNMIGAAHAGNHFLLGGDIDMNPYTAALGSAQAPPCADEGENFFPIGGGMAEDNAGNCSYSTPANYTGVFDGGGKRIRGLRVNEESESNIGFIRVLGPGGKLINTQFENIEIDGHANVGLIGSASAAGSAASVYNVSVEGASIRSREGSSGSLLGNGSNINVDLVYVSDAHVRNDGSCPTNCSTGGVFGEFAGNASNISFKGSVSTDQGEYENVGGIVGSLQSPGSLTAAVSRGTISSRAARVGGIAGRNSFAPIQHVYSNMAVMAQKETGSYVGGLVGNTDGDLKYGYFGGQIINGCFSSCYEGIVFGFPENGSRFNLLAHAHSGAQQSGVTMVAESDARNPVYMHSSAKLNNDSSIWAPLNGRYPKLAFEKMNACDKSVSLESVANQKANGRGSSDKPVVLCTASQFREFLSLSGDDIHREIGESISVGSLNSDQMLPLFKGVLDGRGYSLMNVNLLPTTENFKAGMFMTVDSNAVAKNFTIVGGVEFAASIDYGAVGLLTAENRGRLENITAIGMFDLPDPTVAGHDLGLLAGWNNGVISKVRTGGTIFGNNMLGGIAAKNMNLIELSSADVSIQGSSDMVSYVGGIAGENTGIISKTESRSRIDTATSAMYKTTGVVGGFVGYNNGGSIENSFVDYGEVFVSPATSVNGIGSFVGVNDGSIKYAYSTGKVKVAGASLDEIGGFVGADNGSIGSGKYVYDPVASLLELNSGASISCSADYLSVTWGSELGLHFLDGDLIELFDYAGNFAEVVNFSDMDATTSNSVNLSVSACAGFAPEGLRVSRSAPGLNGGISATTETQMGLIDMYVNEGWDIASFGPEGSGYRQDELLDYYKAILIGADQVPTPPIWEFHHGETPRLVELDQ